MIVTLPTLLVQQLMQPNLARDFVRERSAGPTTIAIHKLSIVSNYGEGGRLE